MLLSIGNASSLLPFRINTYTHSSARRRKHVVKARFEWAVSSALKRGVDGSANIDTKYCWRSTFNNFFFLIYFLFCVNYNTYESLNCPNPLFNRILVVPPRLYYRSISEYIESDSNCSTNTPLIILICNLHCFVG